MSLLFPVARTYDHKVERSVIPSGIILCVDVEIVAVGLFQGGVNRSVLHRGKDTAQEYRVITGKPPTTGHVHPVLTFSKAGNRNA